MLRENCCLHFLCQSLRSMYVCVSNTDVYVTSSSYYLSFLPPPPIHPPALLPSTSHPAKPYPVLCVLRDRYVACLC